MTTIHTLSPENFRHPSAPADRRSRASARLLEVLRRRRAARKQFVEDLRRMETQLMKQDVEDAVLEIELSTAIGKPKAPQPATFVAADDLSQESGKTLNDERSTMNEDAIVDRMEADLAADDTAQPDRHDPAPGDFFERRLEEDATEPTREFSDAY